MSDPKDLWTGVDEPMDVPEDVKSRLVERITGPESSADGGWSLMERLDAPRALPSEIGTRLTATIIGQSRNRRGALYAGLSAVAVITLIASTTLIARDRLGGLPGGGPVGDVSLVAFASDEDFRKYMSSKSMNLVSDLGTGRSIGGGDAMMAPPMPARAPSLVERAEQAVRGGTKSAVGQSDPSTVSEYAPGPQEQDDFSTTNVQERGVDEPDLIKTDGKVLVALSSGKLWVLDVTGAEPRTTGSMPFPGQSQPPAIQGGGGVSLMPVGGPVEEGQLFLDGDRVIHISQTYGTKTETKVTIVSIEDPARPKISSETTLEGSLVGARMSNGAIRLVLRSSPAPELRTPEIPAVPDPGVPGDQPAPFEVTPPTEEELRDLLDENRKIIEEAKPEEWLPEFKLDTPDAAPVVGKIHSWKEVQRPKEFSGISMLSIVTLDPANPSPKDSVSIVGAGEIVYSSIENLYVTTQKDMGNIVIIPRGEPVPSLPQGVTAIRPEDYRLVTQIHKFSISQPGTAVYRASGEVEGTVLNQFSMSEKDGYLRIATTRSQFTEGSLSESFVTILQDKGGKLIGIGTVGGLGKGEQIYAVRFIGDAGFVVTFRQTDPLYVIDLRDPMRPAVRGELKIPGFSNYLHPVSDRLLLGIGQDADEQGRVKGMQVSLFDVSDPATPKRLHQRSLGGEFSSSEAQFDHHAFLYWPKTGLLVIPIISHGQAGPGFVGALALQVDEERGFSEGTQITHAGKIGAPQPNSERLSFPIQVGPQIIRSLVLRESLVTYSMAGLLTNELGSLRERAWVPFIQ